MLLDSLWNPIKQILVLLQVGQDGLQFLVGSKEMSEEELVEIEELEKKYYNFYLELLRENEEYIKAQFQKMSGRLELAETYLLENVIAIGFQELVRSIFFRNTDYDVYMLPTSSDTSFESSDAIIQIDIKTIKSGDIYGDDGMRIIPHPNQSSYPGINEQNSKPFRPALKTQIENKIYLT